MAAIGAQKWALWPQFLFFMAHVLVEIFFDEILLCGVSRASQQNALDIHYCFSTYRTTQLKKMAKHQFWPLQMSKKPLLGTWKGLDRQADIKKSFILCVWMDCINTNMGSTVAKIGHFDN